MPNGDHEHTDERRPFSRLAIASLAFGLLSILPWTVFAAVPAIICGHLARARIRRSEYTGRGRVLATAGLALGYGLAIFWAPQIPSILFAPRAREKARRIACVNNMKSIGLACHLYAADHDGVLPSAWQQLYPDYVPALQCWVCPSTRTSPGDESHIHEWSDYVLVPGRSEIDDADVVLAYCRPGNHGEDGTIILFVAGEVAWVYAEQLGETIPGGAYPLRPDS